MSGLNRGQPTTVTVALYFYCLTKPGGAERMVCQLAGALADRGFTVWLISWDQPGATAFYPLHSGVRWLCLGFNPSVADKLRRAWALARALKETGVQVLVGFVMSGDRTVYAAALLAGIRLVAAERNAPSMYHLRYNYVQRWLSLSFLRLADRITVQLPQFVRGYPYSLQDKIEVIPNPVPVVTNRAQPALANENGRFTLLSVGRLDAVQKRIDRLISAFSRVAAQYPQWDLRIIGDGPAREELLHLVTECQMTERVRIESSIRNVFSAYADAHLFAIPSLWEGFPNALAEAMSHGLPAVGFEDASGVAELIRTGGGGWLAKGLEDETSFAAVLDDAMADGEQRAHRGKLAAQSMATFSPEVQFDRWAAMLESMVSGRTHCV